MLDYDIVRIGLDGSMHRALATNRFELSPSNAPGGYMVWVTDQNGRPEIWLKHEGENWPRPVITPDAFSDSRTTFLFDTALAPDGRRLAFRRSAPGDEAIWISTLTGDAPVRLGREPGHAFQRGPGWSPTGTKSYTSRFATAGRRWSGRESEALAIRGHRGGGRHLPPLGAARQPDRGPRTGNGVTVLDPDGSDRRVLGSGRWLVHGWSADGASLYGVRQAQRVEIVRLDVRSGSETVLAALPVDAATFTLGTALGNVPLRGFSLAEDGAGFYTSLLTANADIWTLKR